MRVQVPSFPHTTPCCALHTPRRSAYGVDRIRSLGGIGIHTELKIRALPVQVRQGAENLGPVVELVDTPDLGSGICEFKSRQGYLVLFALHPKSPLGEMVDTVALKAPSFGVSVQVRQRVQNFLGSPPLERPLGSYSSVVECSIVDRTIRVRFPITAHCGRRYRPYFIGPPYRLVPFLLHHHRKLHRGAG